jgi:mannose-6-phosphate isomerase
MTIAVVSGGFDPVHVGHLRLLRGAQLWGRLVVLLNSDEWLLRKKGFVFMPWGDRAEILVGLGAEVLPVTEDSEGTVRLGLAELLRRGERIVFCNGGDRGSGTTPEEQWCHENGVWTEWGVGGHEKVASSSALVAATGRRPPVQRPWGTYQVVAVGPGWQVKVLRVAPGARLSLQSHARRAERWTVVSGAADVVLGAGEATGLGAGATVAVPVKLPHRLCNRDPEEPLDVVEVQLGGYLAEDDEVRLEDDYGRLCGDPVMEDEDEHE